MYADIIQINASKAVNEKERTERTSREAFDEPSQMYLLMPIGL